jgi:3'(2'), 5'-bisphosphate nucleotidase
MCLWDLAAPQLILEEAGGWMTDLSGKRLDFRKPDPILRSGIVASNRMVHSLILDKVAGKG